MPLEINGETIENGLIDEELNYALSDWGRVPTPEERETLIQSVKEGLIYKTLLRQEAEKLDIGVPAETIDREYRLFFAGRTPPEEEGNVKKYIENKLKESRLIDEICEDLSPPQESHLRSFYEDNRDHYFIAKEFYYREVGFRYPQPELHSRIHDLLSEIRKALLSPTSPTAPTLDEVIEAIKIQNAQTDRATQSDWEELEPHFFTQEWKIPITELSQEGLGFIEHLEEAKVSQITDHPGDSLLFTPVKIDSPTSHQYLGLFIHVRTRKDFIPPFEEVSPRVESDLWEEMRQIKVRAHLRRIMDKSSIRDIDYI